MRFFTIFFSTIGIISVSFIFISIFLIYNIVNPDHDLIDDNYHAIAILSGDLHRAEVASNMYFNKNASLILLSRETALFRDILSNKKNTVYQVYIDFLISKKIDRNNIYLFGDNKSTYDEIKALSDIPFIDKKKILIVTDHYHSYRVKQLFKYFDMPVNVHIFPIMPIENITNKSYIQNVILEYLKLMFFYVFTNYDSFEDYILKL